MGSKLKEDDSLKGRSKIQILLGANNFCEGHASLFWESFSRLGDGLGSRGLVVHTGGVDTTVLRKEKK